MISFKSALAFLLLLGTSSKVNAYTIDDCNTYVFRTSENILWHCGEQLPVHPHYQAQGHRLYCDHSFGNWDYWPWAWASSHADDWCAFMIASVTSEGGNYPLTDNVAFENEPSPNPWWFTTMVDWGCYVVDDVGGRRQTVASWLVKNGDAQPCTPMTIFFDDSQLPGWFNDFHWSGNVPAKDYHPDRSAWGRCHYDASYYGPNYNPELHVTTAECKPGYYCEQLLQDWSFCMPDPRADHECCISWNNKCEERGTCCLGSECNADGFCQVGLELPDMNPDPDSCLEHNSSRKQKTDRKVWSRCYKFETNPPGEDDCADGYICEGDHIYAQCNIDPAAKNECCKWQWDNSNPRPGDCCAGWMAYCHRHDEDGNCVESQCIPGFEEGGPGNEFRGVTDRLCSDPPPEASYNERIDQCTGAICGVWGDPHIVTCDNLQYDCQAVGLFTLMENHMFNIQGRFVHIDTPWGAASVTNDLSIDYVKTEDPYNIPTFQFSFPKLDGDYPTESEVFGNCPLLFYVDKTLVDMSGLRTGATLWEGDGSSVTWTNNNEILIKHYVGKDSNGEDYYSETVVWVDGTGPGTQWSCILTFFVCLPGEEQDAFEHYSLGLLGTPNGRTSDDWMGGSGQTLVIPDHDRGRASFDYCVEHWCVAQDGSIMEYPEGQSYEDFKCADEPYTEFDVNTCPNSDVIIEECAGSDHEITCQMEKCIGNEDPDEHLVKNGDDDDDEDNLVEHPDVEAPDYGDCANLGSGLSGSTGNTPFSATYPNIGCIYAAERFSVGYDHSASILVGGDFTCKRGAGFEGRGVFLGDFTLEHEGCERLSATAHGSLIHPPEDSICIEVGGDVDITASFEHSKYIMYQYGNAGKACHFEYKNGCTLNSKACPHEQPDLEDEDFYTNGDFKHEADLDLDRWADEITLLQQKATYWKSIEPNGVALTEGNLMTLKASSNNSPVQIFKIAPISEDIQTLVFSKDLHGKTILIIIDDEDDFDFVAPNMCFMASDSIPGDSPICDKFRFPVPLTSSIAWLLPHEGMATVSGDHEFFGSIVAPWGSVTASMDGQSGRVIIGGDFIIDGASTELHNYEFDPHNHPLPLGEELDEYCEVQEPVCVENYKEMTSTTVCPSTPEGVVSVIHSSHDLPEGEAIIYDIVMDPSEDDSAKTLKFKVDNPFANHTDIFIKHVKKVGKYAMDPVCDSMPFTAGCSYDAPEIEIGCHEYDGVDPFALVNLYFASNTDAFVAGAGNEDVTIDKCCKPPEEYAEDGYGIIEVTLEIKCVCPDVVSS